MKLAARPFSIRGGLHRLNKVRSLLSTFGRSTRCKFYRQLDGGGDQGGMLNDLCAYSFTFHCDSPLPQPIANRSNHQRKRHGDWLAGEGRVRGESRAILPLTPTLSRMDLPA